MPQLVVLPHVELCPDGAVIDATPGKSICDNLLEHGIEIEHACEVVRVHDVPRGDPRRLQRSDAVREDEDDLLDKAWGLEPTSRLSCQAIVKEDSRPGGRDSEVLDQPREGKPLTGTEAGDEMDRFA